MKKISVKELALGYERQKERLMKHSALQITGNRELIADGCRKIINCDENIIVIALSDYRLTITGSGLKLRNWGTDGVTVAGKMQTVEWGEKYA